MPVAAPRAIPSLLDVKRERCKRSFYAFFVEFFDVMEPAEAYVDTWHVKALCDHAQAFAEGRIKNLSIEIGPGFMKSLVMAVALPAWSWISRPHLRWAFSTYQAELTERDSNRCKELILSDKYQQMFGHAFQLKLGQKRSNFFENTARGSRRALSVKGGATGHRIHRWVGDDLLNAPDAHSPAERRDVVEHLRAMSSRGVNQASYGRAVIGQRLHEEDAGGWARTRGFEVLCLPTEYDPARCCSTSIGFTDPRTVKGQLLSPLRFGQAEVDEAKLDMGPYGYSAQHQQLPVPAGGGILKNEWWRDYRYGKAPQPFHTVLQFWDTAYTVKEANDTSAVTTWGIAISGVFLLDAKSFRMETPDLLEQMKVEAGLWNPHEVLVECKANGQDLLDFLKKDAAWKWKLTPVNPLLGKEARAHAVAPHVARGRAYIARTQPHAVSFLEQTDVFPAAKVRDLADSGVSALLHIFTSYTFGEAMAPAFSPEKSKTAEWLRSQKERDAAEDERARQAKLSRLAAEYDSTTTGLY